MFHPAPLCWALLTGGPPSVPPVPLGPSVTRRVCVCGLRPDVLFGAGIPLAMEALHGFVELYRAGRGQPRGPARCGSTW